MAKRSRKTNSVTINRRIQEGRGQGHGKNYKPWLTIQDVPSRGLSHRIEGWKTGRVHHLFSNLERDYFYLLDWSEMVVDIREQYPLLPLDETEQIARQIGVRHPVDPSTRHPIIMTTDFVVDAQFSDQLRQQARTVKQSAALNKPRTLEKLEIERRYWQARDVDWGIVTEREIPSPFTDNVRLLHGYQQIRDRIAPEMNISEGIQMLLDNQQAETIGDLAQYSDEALNYPPGTALTILYHLLATHQLRVNMFLPLNHDVPLLSLSEVAS